MKNGKAYIWSLLGRTIPQIVLLLTTMVLSRQLSATEFGTIGVLSVLYMVAGTILDSGLGGSLIKENHITKDDCATIFTFNLFVSIVFYFLIYIAAPYVEAFYSVKNLAFVTRVLSLILIVNAFGIVPNSLLIKELQFKERTLINIIAVIIASVTAILIAYKEGGVFALIALQIVQSLVNVILYHCFCKYQIRIGFKIQSFKRLYKFGVFTTLVNVCDSLYENVLTSFCGKFLNIQQAGYMSQAKRIEEVASQSIFQTINSVSFPVLAKLSERIEEFHKEASVILKHVILLSFPPMLILSIYSKQIVTLVFGSSWLPSANYLSLLVFAALFIILENTNRNFIKSLGAVSYLLFATIIKRLLGILLLVIMGMVDSKLLLPAYVISSAIGFSFNVLLYCKISNIGLFKYLNGILLTLLCPFCFYVFNIIFVKYLSNNLTIDVLFTGTILLLYYLRLLPMYDINIKEYIKNK